MKKAIAASAVAVLMVAASSAMAADGKKTYDTACFACHATGAAGAPKFGDKAAWAPRIKQGIAVLQDHALHGYKGNTGFMPPKGGYAHLSDDDVKAAAEYMANAGK